MDRKTKKAEAINKSIKTLKDWRKYEESPLRITDYVIMDFPSELGVAVEPMKRYKRELPYVSLLGDMWVQKDNTIRKANCYIDNKYDFINFLKALQLKKRGEEIWVIWTESHYKSDLYRLISRFLPHMIFEIRPSKSLEALTFEFNDADMSESSKIFKRTRKTATLYARPINW